MLFPFVGSWNWWARFLRSYIRTIFYGRRLFSGWFGFAEMARKSESSALAADFTDIRLIGRVVASLYILLRRKHSSRCSLLGVGVGEAPPCGGSLRQLCDDGCPEDSLDTFFIQFHGIGGFSWAYSWDIDCPDDTIFVSDSHGCTIERFSKWPK